MGYPNDLVSGFGTFLPDTKRGETPILPDRETGTDYGETMPPIYPKRELWSHNRALFAKMWCSILLKWTLRIT